MGIREVIYIPFVKHDEMPDFAQMLVLRGSKTASFMDGYYIDYNQHIQFSPRSTPLGRDTLFFGISGANYSPGNFHNYITINPDPCNFDCKLQDKIVNLKPSDIVVKVIKHDINERDTIDNRILEMIKQNEAIRKSSKPSLKI
jgi:hypothetical protein